jgi:hypothetical protein
VRVLEFKLSRVDSVFQGRLHDFNVNYMGFQYVERVLSQKPGSGVCADRVRSQKPLVRARVDRVSSQKPW